MKIKSVVRWQERSGEKQGSCKGSHVEWEARAWGA